MVILPTSYRFGLKNKGDNLFDVRNKPYEACSPLTTGAAFSLGSTGPLFIPLVSCDSLQSL